MYLSAVLRLFYVLECSDYVLECSDYVLECSSFFVECWFYWVLEENKKRKILEEYLRYSKRDNFFLTVKLSYLV
jgi:hypothetical protein